MVIGVDIRCLMEKNYSGISVYTFELLKKILEIDKINKYILFYNSSKKSNIPKFAGDNVEIKGYNFPNKFFNLSMALLNAPKIDKLIGGPNCFWLPSFQFCAFSEKIKLVATAHDLSFIKYPEFFTKKSLLWHKLINSKKICRQADTIAAMSQNTKNDLVDLYKINPDKISVIYSGISENFRPIKDEAILNKIRQKYQLPKNYIFSLGNIEPRKNIYGLISAFKELKTDFCLVIAGAKSWKYAKINKIKNLNKNKIKFIGYVDASDKPALYSMAKIFVYPSFYEGFGFPPLEAMACGAPVITSNNSSLTEACGNAAVYIDPYDINDIGKAIKIILSDESLSKSLSEASLLQSKKYNWEITAKKMVSIFEKKKA